jgi:hypothetical protein
MSRRIALSGAVFVICVVLAGASAARQFLVEDTERPTAAADQEHFLPKDLLITGKSIVLGIDGNDVDAKVLEQPRGSWLKVETQVRGKTTTAWINLGRVAYIMSGPLPRCEGGGCPGAGPSY